MFFYCTAIINEQGDRQDAAGLIMDEHRQREGKREGLLESHTQNLAYTSPVSMTGGNLLQTAAVSHTHMHKWMY